MKVARIDAAAKDARMGPNQQKLLAGLHKKQVDKRCDKEEKRDGLDLG